MFTMSIIQVLEGKINMTICCLPETNLDSDQPYWTSKTNFIQYFDQVDFYCREVKNIEFSYLEEWFCTSENGTLKSLYCQRYNLYREKCSL